MGLRVALGAFAVAVFGCTAFFAAPALADGWLPDASNATWTYQWMDSAYNPTPTNEIVTVQSTSGDTFTLAWTTDGAGNPDSAPASNGTVTFQQTSLGIVNTDWSSTPPPSNFPILCPSLSSCGNSLASAYYNVIWGSRAPVLFEPLLQGTSWATTGGAQNDVTSTNDYLGLQQVKVPAFPQPVTAAVIRSQITQAGAIGDPYGSGTRTTWWVYGVGPVKLVFQHAGGTGAPTTTVELESTNQTPAAPPPDADYFPIDLGHTGVYRWTNSKYLKKPEVEHYTVAQAQNGTAIFKVGSVSGPMKVSGVYEFTKRLDGVTNVASAVKAASRAKFPPLGPRSLSAKKRRHFFTPFDLMTFGFNPVIPAYPTVHTTWKSKLGSRDFATYGVTGTTHIVGFQKVKVSAGTFRALVVRSTLRQPGFPFGSGTRTCWFAPGKGLVKLVFHHGDGSVSTVQLVR